MKNGSIWSWPHRFDLQERLEWTLIAGMATEPEAKNQQKNTGNYPSSACEKTKNMTEHTAKEPFTHLLRQ